jgi:predicted transcriptional regulator
MSTTLTIELPDELADRAKAAAGRKDFMEAVTAWVRSRLEETPLEEQSDDEVSRAATAVMATNRQAELSDLLADQRESRLTPEGRVRLDELMGEYRRGLLAKAKAVNEAVRRGLLRAGGHAA